MTAPPPRGTPLDPGSYVVRLWVQQSLPFDEAEPVPPNAFELSNEEKDAAKHPDGWTSVWCEEHTSPHEAAAFATEPKPRRAAILPVDAVRTLASPFAPGAQLDLFWDPRPEEFVPETGALRIAAGEIPRGAEGHCGLSGLAEQHCPAGLTRNERKARRLALREELASLANQPDIRKMFLEPSRP